MNRPTKGDLVHIPANCCMYDPKNIKNPQRYYIPTTPMMGVLLDSVGEEMTTVYVNGDYWAVDNQDIYPVKQRSEDG